MALSFNPRALMRERKAAKQSKRQEEGLRAELKVQRGEPVSSYEGLMGAERIQKRQLQSLMTKRRKSMA